MALLLFLRFGLVLLLIGLHLDENGPFLPVNAVPNVEIPGPIINITVPPPQTVLLSQINAPLLLPCTVAIKNMTVDKRFNFEFHTWYRNGKKLVLGRRSDFQIHANGSLRLPYKKGNASYRCLVNGTELGLGVMLSTESIVQSAVLKRIPVEPNIVANEGNFLVLDCPAVSYPSPNVTWSYGNNPIDARFAKKRYMQLENGTLIIKNVSEFNKGKYKCVATNKYAAKSHCQFTWNVTVTQATTNDDVAERLLPPMQPELQHIPSGQDFKLRCLGYTDTVEWYFLPMSAEFPFKINNNSNEIFIRNASIDKHQGMYNCSTKIDFQVFQVVITSPPKIIQPLGSYESTLAAMVTLSCKAEGNPPPEITWYRNGIKIENTYTVHHIPPVLRINSFDLKDDGLYQCFAKNTAGEAVTSGLLSLRRKEDLVNIPRRPENVKCFPVNYKTLNVTFESSSRLLFMSIHFATDNPYKWNSTHPVELESNSYLLITKGLPILKPFVLYMRGLVQTSIQNVNGHQERTFDISLLTRGVQCATQGLTVNGVFFPNGIFIWWTPLKIITPKYYIIQFNADDGTGGPIFGDTVVGSTHEISFYHTSRDIERHLHKIPVLNATRVDSKLKENSTTKTAAVSKLVVPGNVTGILIPNATRVIVRTLVITSENENLEQDFHYLEWKTIENNTANDFAFRIAHTESRKVTFLWNPIRDISCIKACYSSMNPEAIIRDDQEKYCQDIYTTQTYFTVKKLKPLTPYRIDFLDCKSLDNYGTSEVYTKSDPPGPITNQKIIRGNGLKLSWDPPINSNGKIIYYVILWTLNNSTHEVNVTSTENSFEFPKVTESDKINITVRVMGESGIGPPIFIDLRNVQPDVLEKESDYFISPSLGIALGVFLSLVCILFFAFLFIRQRRRFKNRTNNQNRSSPSEQNFSMTTTPNIELHEMQTLIPKYSSRFDANVQNRTLPNGNGVHFQQNAGENGPPHQEQHELNDVPPIALCSSTPLTQRRRDLSDILYAENEPIMNKSSEATQLNKISSSPNFFNNPKGIASRNETQLQQNGSIKTLLPPLKHSISPVSSSEPKLLDTDGGIKKPDGLRCEQKANPKTSTIDNSRLKLLGTNLDRTETSNYSSDHDKTCNSNNLTANTMVSLDDTASSFRSPMGKINWNYHRRPVIDPNG